MTHDTETFLSMTGVAASRVHEPIDQQSNDCVQPGVYKKANYDEFVSVVESDNHRVTFIPLGCGTTATQQETQQCAETLDAEVFKMVYKPYTAVDSQKAA